MHFNKKKFTVSHAFCN